MSHSNTPKFDVHGFSGCPLQVLSSPSFFLIQNVVETFSSLVNPSKSPATTASEFADLAKFSSPSAQNESFPSSPLYRRHRYFVLKLSSSQSYNARLKKQAEKQQFFINEMFEARKKDHQLEANKTSPGSFPSSLFLQVPEILYIESHCSELVRSFLLDEDASKSLENILSPSSNEIANNTNSKEDCMKFLQNWKNTVFEAEQNAKEENGTNNEAGNTLSAVIMPFIHHTDCLRFLCTADFTRIERFEDHLCNFLQWQVNSCCSLQNIPVDVIVSKLVDLKKVCSRHESILKTLKISDEENEFTKTISDGCIELLEKLIIFFNQEEFKNDVKIPMGCCHGDLTLSNILVQESTNDKVVLIDFLDSFLESPLSDMCKLNQDLTHGWTIRMLATNNQNKSSSDSVVDPVRLFILFERMMNKIVLKPFGDQDWFKKLFRPFCLISQMRVLQYSTDETVARYLWKTIEYEKDLCDEKNWM